MPGSTPIYGFPYPEPSDLVANYPALGQELAEDIEAVLPTLGGMTLVSANVFTTSAAVNNNNVFTSANAVYYVVGTATMSGTDRPKFRLRVGGVDATGASDYSFALIDINSGTVSGTTGGTSAWIPFAGTINGGIMPFAFTLINPATAVFTQMVNATGFDGTPRMRTFGGRHQQATAYDGFSITPETGGTMTGAVYIYKLKTS